MSFLSDLFSIFSTDIGLSLTLDRKDYLPGDIVRATVETKSAKPFKIRGVYATLLCEERKLVKSTRVMDKWDYDRDKELGVTRSSNLETVTTEEGKRWFEQTKQLVGEGEIACRRFEIEFQLPPNSPPTDLEYGENDRITFWKLYVKVDIPMAKDKNAEEDVIIRGITY